MRIYQSSNTSLVIATYSSVLIYALIIHRMFRANNNQSHHKKRNAQVSVVAQGTVVLIVLLLNRYWNYCDGYVGAPALKG